MGDGGGGCSTPPLASFGNKRVEKRCGGSLEEDFEDLDGISVSVAGFDCPLSRRVEVELDPAGCELGGLCVISPDSHVQIGVQPKSKTLSTRGF